jgi:hypothetical protein
LFFLSLENFSFTASVSVRNIRNIPKVPLTVKPDPNDTLNRSLNGAIGSNTNNYYYETNNYSKPSDEVNSLYINGQAPQQQGISIHQDPQHHQYAVVKKTGSKRDIRENLERENSAIFKVSLTEKVEVDFDVFNRNIGKLAKSYHKSFQKLPQILFLSFQKAISENFQSN